MRFQANRFLILLVDLKVSRSNSNAFSLEQLSELHVKDLGEPNLSTLISKTQLACVLVDLEELNDSNVQIEIIIPAIRLLTANSDYTTEKSPLVRVDELVLLESILSPVLSLPQDLCLSLFHSDALATEGVRLLLTFLKKSPRAVVEHVQVELLGTVEETYIRTMHPQNIADTLAFRQIVKVFGKQNHSASLGHSFVIDVLRGIGYLDSANVPVCGACCFFDQFVGKGRVHDDSVEVERLVATFIVTVC